MNRRNFLQRSGFAAAAVTGLPLALKKAADPDFHIYTHTEYRKKVDTEYALVISHAAVKTLSYATDSEKVITLSVKDYNKDGALLKSGQFNFTAQRSDKSGDSWKLQTKLTGRVSGDYTLPKKFPSDMYLLMNPFSSAEIQTAKGKSFTLLSYKSAYNPSSSSSGGCFLTTACVEHKQLADDCDELQTLRCLRDNYMRTTEEGQWLIQQYGSIAPGIVYAIDQCENKSEIYEYMYDNMISPAVQLVKQGEWREATEHYMVFVKALKEKYCE
jgi:hypothetical protein